jgi:hypothetical protein
LSQKVDDRFRSVRLFRDEFLSEEGFGLGSIDLGLFFEPMEKGHILARLFLFTGETSARGNSK